MCIDFSLIDQHFCDNGTFCISVIMSLWLICIYFLIKICNTEMICTNLINWGGFMVICRVSYSPVVSPFNILYYRIAS